MTADRIATALLTALALAGCARTPPLGATPPPPTPRAEADPGPDDAAHDDGELPVAEEVLSKAVTALGGRARLDAIESLYAKSSLTLSEQAPPATVELWWKGGDYYLRMEAADVGVSQLWKRATEIWADDPVGGRRRLSGKEAEQASIGATPSLAGHWKAHFVRAETIALRRAEGRSLVDVELATASGTTMTMSFDRQTGLPYRLAMVQHTPLGELATSTTYEDYREVDGIKHPFRSVTRMSMFSSELTVDAIEHGIPIDPSRFAPPPPSNRGSGPAAPVVTP